MKNPDDGKFVVVQDGKRVSGELHETQAGAQAEAEKAKRQVNESAPTEQPKVVQNLYG
jgi:hypothetical protein